MGQRRQDHFRDCIDPANSRANCEITPEEHLQQIGRFQSRAGGGGGVVAGDYQIDRVGQPIRGPACKGSVIILQKKAAKAFRQSRQKTKDERAGESVQREAVGLTNTQRVW